MQNSCDRHQAAKPVVARADLAAFMDYWHPLGSQDYRAVNLQL